MLKDITGMRFGSLVVKERHFPYVKREGTKWVCVCDCSNTKVINGTSLKCGATKSCGCMAKKVAGERFATHGMSKTRLYQCWAGMYHRKKYDPRYKSRDVSDEWKDFSKFAEWALANGYSDNLSLDRIDNSKGYSPDNCRWATRIMQNQNKSNNVNLTFNGETHCIAEWSRILNVKKGTLWSRYKSGMSVEKILTTRNLKTNKELI